ncbi:hypothetical protein EDB80DRAFT_879814, partial [Ilyonectria destructans]
MQMGLENNLPSLKPTRFVEKAAAALIYVTGVVLDPVITIILTHLKLPYPLRTRRRIRLILRSEISLDTDDDNGELLTIPSFGYEQAESADNWLDFAYRLT